MKQFLSKFLAQKGFSLVEIILLTGVVGMIILVVANIPNAINLVGSSKYESLAREIAAKTIADTRAKGFDALANNAPNGISINDSRVVKLPGGSANLIIEACPQEICSGGSGEENMVKKVTIQVSWKENSQAKDFSIV